MIEIRSMDVWKYGRLVGDTNVIYHDVVKWSMRKMLDKETSAAIATGLGFTLIVPAIMFWRAKDEYVRFWAAQSLVFFLLVFLADAIVLRIRIFNFLPSLIFLLTMIVWLIMVYKSWLGYTWEIPLVGKLAKRVHKQGGSRT